MSSTNDESSSPFSEKARLKKLVSAEGLDILMQVVSPKGWISLICCIGIIVISLIWGFMGTIPITVSGNGISMTEQGPYVVTAYVQGTVIDIYARAGEYVNEGDMLIKLENATLALEIQMKKADVLNKENELKTFEKLVQEEDEARKAAIVKEIEANEFALKKTESQLPFLKKDLESKTRLKAKGIVPSAQVEQAKTALSVAEIQIESYKASLETLEADFIKSYRTEEIEAKKDALLAATGDLSRLLLENSYTEIYAEKSGKVLELVVAPGDRVNVGSEVAAIEVPLEKGHHLHYYACFSAEYGDLLDINLPMQIEVSGVDPKMYGYLLGKTTFISPYPITSIDLVSDVRNAEIADYLKGGNKVVYSAIIQLQTDPDTVSGYKWTSKTGPPWQLSSGTIGVARMVIERKAPIIYILPVEIAPSLYHLLHIK